MATSGKEGEKKGDDWVIIQEEKPHTRERSPQYNEENESQAQLAGSSSGIGGSFVIVTDEMLAEAGYPVGSDNADSQDTSTENGASIKTVADPGQTRVTPSVGLPLTKLVLDINERQPQNTYAGSIAMWVDGVGNIARRYQVTPAYEASLANSVYSWSGNVEASVTSTMSLDREPIEPALNDDVREAGAWCKTRSMRRF